MREDGVPTFHAKDIQAWRSWLEEYHQKHSSLWLIIYHKDSETASIAYPEAVAEALCFGWVDSKPNKRDAESYFQYFSVRSPKSNWSRVNKEKVARLIEQKRMTETGYKMIELAKSNGTWDALNDVENLVIPSDLMQALKSFPNAFDHYDAFPRSVKRGILEWIMNAKRKETRQKRIEETAGMANENLRANQYRKQ